MLEIKEIIGAITIILSVIAYAPYIKDTIQGKTKPHIYTWLIGGGVTFIIFLLQFLAGGGPGTWVTLTVSIFSLIIAALSARQADWDITKLDTIFLIAAIIALILWLIIDQPTISMLLLVGVGVLGFAPTIRKTWNRPETETLSTYLINTLRHGLSFLALSHYTLLTGLFPGIWTILNAVISIMIIFRRRRY